MPNTSVSWKAPRPIRERMTCAVMAHQGRGVQIGVRNGGDHVGGAGAGSGDTDAHLARNTAVAFRSKRAALFVAGGGWSGFWADGSGPGESACWRRRDRQRRRLHLHARGIPRALRLLSCGFSLGRMMFCRLYSCANNIFICCVGKEVLAHSARNVKPFSSKSQRRAACGNTPGKMPQHRRGGQYQERDVLRTRTQSMPAAAAAAMPERRLQIPRSGRGRPQPFRGQQEHVRSRFAVFHVLRG